jgi:hypothetical protein
MAKQKSRTRPDLPEKTDDIYIFLIKNTPAGWMDPKKWEDGARRVSKAITDRGGECTFYQTPGETYDGVSIVTGLSLDAAMFIANLINSFGTVVGTRMSGLKMTK